MKQMLKDWGAALAVGVLVYVLAGWMFAPKQLDGLAPDFTLTRADGGSLQLTALRGKVTVVNFWGSWCGPCRQFAPVFEAASEKHPDFVFAKVNSDEEQALAGQFGIRSIPTLMVFREQVILFSEAGALPAPQLDALLEQARTLDMAEVHREIAEREGGGPDAGTA
jgi:thioredoxin